MQIKLVKYANKSANKTVKSANKTAKSANKTAKNANKMQKVQKQIKSDSVLPITKSNLTVNIAICWGKV